MSIADEIEKLNNLKKSGAITEEEYQSAKDSLIKQHDTIGEKLNYIIRNFSSDENIYSMFMHLSQLCGYFLFLVGFVVPIVMWQLKKDESEIIDRHGRNIVNWIITEIIFVVVFWILTHFIIGYPLLGVLFILSLVFPIIGGIKANNGEIWPYPFSIKFFSAD